MNNSAVNCSAYADVCVCFAANVGQSCSFCDGACVHTDEVSEKCPTSSSDFRRGQSALCGEKYLPNIVEQLPDVPGKLTSMFSSLTTSDNVTIELLSVFQVQYIEIKVSGGTVGLDVWPVSYNNEKALEQVCTDQVCKWVLRVPFVRNITFYSTVPGEEMVLENLHVPMAPYSPIDGGWGRTTDWTICSNLCGYGEQYQNRTCSSPEPSYGGLDCKPTDGFTTYISRECSLHSDCGTDWRVVLIIGWWQFVVLVVFFGRKIHGCIQAKKDEEWQLEKSRRRRFSSDFDTEVGMDEDVGPAGDDNVYYDGVGQDHHELMLQ
uniref:Uncharacterized protein n=1 Tax=Mucochytrium quahogii TaxID=96639 RepID=A0A7S2RQ27_9STRA|mmetsp:Transcript_12017/g.19556  ORF Transcript_12017/g.19556 Transcript_12017/m.19556 type:complete len:320 (+) Transcript_12017:386-1345(+)